MGTISPRILHRFLTAQLRVRIAKLHKAKQVEDLGFEFEVEPLSNGSVLTQR
jgi:hypothetical protein